MITFKITQKFKASNELVLEIVGIQSIGKANQFINNKPYGTTNY